MFLCVNEMLKVLFKVEIRCVLEMDFIIDFRYLYDGIMCLYVIYFVILLVFLYL